MNESPELLYTANVTTDYEDTMTAATKAYALFLSVVLGLTLLCFSAPSLWAANCQRGDCQNGDGIFAFPDGSTFTGHFKDAIMDGKGTFTWPNGNKYVGDFRAGKRDGQGTFTWGNGNIYRGGFSNDRRDGQGTFVGADGHKYVGGYRNGLKQGDGVFTSPAGDRYEGTFSDGQMDGEGTFVWANGDTYVGDFLDGQMHGNGTYTLANNGAYSGTFINDHMDGEGIFTWENGDSYNGTISFQKLGTGVLTTREGHSTKGTIQVAAKIIEVLPGSQAEEKKLLAGDTIVEYRGATMVGGAQTLSRLVGITRPYEQVRIKLLRNGELQTLDISGGRIGVKLVDYPVFSALPEE